MTAADLSVVNLAAPVSTDADPIERTGPTRRTAPETPTRLREAGFNVATLANDHSMDYGERGLERTIDPYHGSSLLTSGAGDGVEDAMAPVYLTVEGTSVAVFDFCERGFGVAREGETGTAWISHPNARRRVAEEADRSEVVGVIARGGVEHVPVPSPRRQGQLREFAEVGADLVDPDYGNLPFDREDVSELREEIRAAEEEERESETSEPAAEGSGEPQPSRSGGDGDPRSVESGASGGPDSAGAGSAEPSLLDRLLTLLLSLWPCCSSSSSARSPADTGNGSGPCFRRSSGRSGHPPGAVEPPSPTHGPTSTRRTTSSEPG